MLRIPVNFARMAPALEVTSILVNFKLVPRLLSPIWTSFFPSLEGSRFDRVWIAHSIRRLEAIPLALSFFVPVNPLLLRLNYAAFTRLLPYKKSWHEVHFKVSSKTHLKLCWFESVATLSFHWWGLFKSLCGAKKNTCVLEHMDIWTGVYWINTLCIAGAESKKGWRVVIYILWHSCHILGTPLLCQRKRHSPSK